MIQKDYNCQCNERYQPVLPGAEYQRLGFSLLLYDHFISIGRVSCHIIYSCAVKGKTDCQNNRTDNKRREYFPDLTDKQSYKDRYNTADNHGAENRIYILCLGSDRCHCGNVREADSDNNRKAASQLDFLRV